MFYAPATRSCASRSPPPADDKEPTMSDISGRLFEMPWACFVHGSWYSRTCGATCPSDSERFSGTWPTSGSMRGGACFEHPTWGHPISAPDCSLLPTPRTNEANGTGDHGTGGPDLRTLVDSLLPTPTSRDHKGRNQRDDTTCLPEAIHYLPTPTASDAVGSRNRTAKRRPDSKHHDGVTLTDVFWTGDSTDPPSNDGNTSTDPHQPPLPTEG